METEAKTPETRDSSCSLRVTEAEEEETLSLRYKNIHLQQSDIWSLVFTIYNHWYNSWS